MNVEDIAKINEKMRNMIYKNIIIIEMKMEV